MLCLEGIKSINKNTELNLKRSYTVLEMENKIRNKKNK